MLNEREDITCPNCESANIRKGGQCAKKISPGEPFPNKSHQIPNFCKDCKYEWLDKI